MSYTSLITVKWFSSFYFRDASQVSISRYVHFKFCSLAPPSFSLALSLSLSLSLSLYISHSLCLSLALVVCSTHSKSQWTTASAVLKYECALVFVSPPFPSLTFKWTEWALVFGTMPSYHPHYCGKRHTWDCRLSESCWFSHCRCGAVYLFTLLSCSCESWRNSKLVWACQKGRELVPLWASAVCTLCSNVLYWTGLDVDLTW